ncbi:MAG: hypothetical protein ACUVT7_02535 [Thermoplasmata archaeon]
MSEASSRRGGIQGLSFGYLMIAFAVSILISWLAEDWWLLVPVFMLLAGVFYVALGIVIRPREQAVKKGYRSSSFFVFWGGTVGLIGTIFLLNMEFPGNAVLLVVMFILWVGIVAVVLSLGRFREGPETAK